MDHPFEKEDPWAFTARIFLVVKWGLAIEIAGEEFSYTRETTRVWAADLLFCELTEDILTTSQAGTSSSTAPRPGSDSSGGEAPLSRDVQSQFPTVSGASHQEESDPLSSERDLTAPLAHLGVVLDWEESDPETALRGGVAKASLALAWEEYSAGQFDKVMTDMTALVNDATLQDNPRFVSVHAAAHYIRGLAQEKQGNKAQAILDFQSALQLIPDYELAKQAWSVLCKQSESLHCF